MRRERRAAHKRPPWPERVFHEEIEPLIHDPAPLRRVWTMVLLGSVVVLALAAGVLGVLRATGITGDETGPASRPHGSSSSPAASPTASSPDDREALEDCRNQWSLQHEVLTSAGPAMRQWAKHITAMNQLVSGRITLADAQAYWARTRVGAARNVHRFEAADEEVSSSAGSPCMVASPPAGASAALAGCLDAVDAGSTALESARTTMATWHHHIRDMERLRTGKLSPAMAQQMWLRTWKQGDRELHTFRRDEARFEALACAT
jgi:hypothetical protein